MAKKASNTTKSKIVNGTTDDNTISVKAKAEKLKKKIEKENITTTKAKSKATSATDKVKVSKKNTVKSKIENEAVEAKPVDTVATKATPKAKKKAEPDVSLNKKTVKKADVKVTKVEPVATEIEKPKKKVSSKKKTTIEIESNVAQPEKKEDKIEITREIPAEVSVQKAKRASKKTKEKTTDIEKPIQFPTDENLFEDKSDVEPALVPNQSKAQSVRPGKSKSRAAVVANKIVMQPDLADIVPPPENIQPKKDTTHVVAKKEKPILPSAKPSTKSDTNDIAKAATDVQAVAEPQKLTKSQRRRAKKKAKKLREQQQLEQSAVKQPDKPVAPVEQQQPVLKNKRHDRRDNGRNKNRNSFPVNQNVAPIYSNQDIETVTKPVPDAFIDKPQYVSHRKLQVKPIPWADLSKFTNEKKATVAKDATEHVPVNISKLLTATQRRDPFFQNFYREVEKFVISEMLVENGSKVLVTVSGGVDSVVMLDVFANLSAKYNFIVYVAHYNHNLRGETSDNDAEFVKSLAASYNIPCYASSGKVLQHAEKTGMSVEESARFLRYYFFERVARTLKTDFVATAHTADDLAETFLLNLFRGTGLTGLSGIPSRRQLVKDVIIIRPFLNFSKQKLKEYAEKRNLEWHEDDTNLQDKYTRNKIRNNLVPKLQNEYSNSIIEIINRSAKLIQGADRIIHDYVRTHLPSVMFDISNDSISIKLTLFKTFDEFIRGEMLQTILMKYFKLLPLPMKLIDRIIKLEQSDSGAICEISKNIIAIKDRQTLIITKKIIPNKINQKIEKKGKFTFDNITFVLKEIDVADVEYNRNPCIEYFDANLVSNTLQVRNWEHGDAFNPLGMSNVIKLSDFLINEKVSILDKPNVLVLTNSNNEIMWVCKYRISDKFKITKDTKKVLQIEIKEKQK